MTRTSRTWRVPKPATPEGSIKNAIRSYLGWKGWRSYVIMQGPLAHKGISDLIAIKGGKVLFIEVKTPTGRLSDHQMQFKTEIEQQGGTYIVARSVDAIVDYLEGRG